MARPRDADAPAVRPLPVEICRHLDRQPRPRNGDNLGLWLDKYLPLDKEKYELRGPQRERVLGDLFVARDLGKPAPWRSDAARESLARQRESCQILYGKGYFRELRAELRGRLLVDYARVSTIESSLSLHHALGVPRIPGSALKGLLRAALRPRLSAKDLADLVGAPDLEAPPSAQTIHRRGRLVLHDALPEDGQFQIDLDVLTPHFREYYEGEGATPPADWLSPIPHGFLTVVNTTFRILVGILPPYPTDENPAPARERDAEYLDTVEETLRVALWQEGLGAKRSAGYGRLLVNQA